MKPKLKWVTISGRDYQVCSECEHTPAHCICPEVEDTNDDWVDCDCYFCVGDMPDDY